MKASDMHNVVSIKGIHDKSGNFTSAMQFI